MTHSAYLELLSRCWQRWPDLRRYEATARRGGLRFDGQRGVMVWSEEAVTVTVTNIDDATIQLAEEES